MGFYILCQVVGLDLNETYYYTVNKQTKNIKRRQKFYHINQDKNFVIFVFSRNFI